MVRPRKADLARYSGSLCEAVSDDSFEHWRYARLQPSDCPQGRSGNRWLSSAVVDGPCRPHRFGLGNWLPIGGDSACASCTSRNR
jgi:hypothetical protein